jgi:hypothetical protein
VKLIPLSKGMEAIIDDEDYAALSCFKWTASASRNKFYARRNIIKPDGKQLHVYMHRQILGLRKGVLCDHKNGNGLDNRRDNLRPATSAQNQANQPGYRGTRLKRNKWSAEFKCNGLRHYIGTFLTEEDAHAAYIKAKREQCGEFSPTEWVKK